MQQPQQAEDFSLREIIYPNIRVRAVRGYDLVVQMPYLYVRVVKAKDLPGKDVTGSCRCDPYVEIAAGNNYKGTTKYFEKKSDPEWNQVFAFSEERIKDSVLEVAVKDKDVLSDDLIGKVTFDLCKIPKRVPPDSSLAPQWYRLEDGKGDNAKGELMLAVWMGTQADEEFLDAFRTDAASVHPDSVANIRPKVYVSPKLWYVRVNVIEARDLLPNDKNRSPEVFVRAVIGNQAFRTSISQRKTINPVWNEELMFVTAEPFEEPLVLTVEDGLGSNKDAIMGRCVIPLHIVRRRSEFDHKPVKSRWHTLEKQVIVDERKETKFASRIHLQICLEGGYNVFDESTLYSSDLGPTEKRSWRPSIGTLELGILGARGLIPMKDRDGRKTTDAYCLAKYGQKWVRTRTIVDNFVPEWNEQYSWEVFDPCTVITVGVFDNGHIHGGSAEDAIFGKVRIRLSILEAGRIYTHSYPLVVLNPEGVKKTGEVQLAVRFTCSTWINMLLMYSHPPLPKMHYTHPLPLFQLDSLRCKAIQIVSMRLSRAEPPLMEEVVEYMLDDDSHVWSLRRSKAAFYRIMAVLSGLLAVGKWFDQICKWRKPLQTILIHILFVLLVLYPKLILPAVFLYLFLIGTWNYRWRPRHPCCMDVRLSHAVDAHPDELDEEFDTFPTCRPSDIVRMRYDRLRSVLGRIVMVFGDLVVQGERFQSLLSWRDTRATIIFVTFCLITSIVLYVTPSKAVALLIGFYVMRHPMFRPKLASAPINFFSRLPTRKDDVL